MVLLDWLVLQLETLDFDMLILNLLFFGSPQWRIMVLLDWLVLQLETLDFEM